MTIFFDEKKQAYGFKIDNAVATIDDETWEKYSTTDKWDIIEGKFTDISDTDSYKSKAQAQENEKKKNELQRQIDDLDQKRIRAMAEPSQKDATTSWLEYYTEQIKILRGQIITLSS